MKKGQDRQQRNFTVSSLATTQLNVAQNTFFSFYAKI
jgi:hypothetical protein